MFAEREGSMGFRRADYCATPDCIKGGGFPPAMFLFPFSLYATFVSSYLSHTLFFVLGPPPIVSAHGPPTSSLVLRPSSSSIVTVHRRRPSSPSIVAVHRRRPSSPSIVAVHRPRPSSPSIVTIHRRRLPL